MPAALGARDIDHQLQVRELDPQRRRSGPQPRAVVGVVVDLAQDGVEDLLELLLCQRVRGHLTLNLRSTLSLCRGPRTRSSRACRVRRARAWRPRRAARPRARACPLPSPPSPRRSARSRTAEPRRVSRGLGTLTIVGRRVRGPSLLSTAHPSTPSMLAPVPHHLRPSTEYAPDALLPGDPGRALALAQQLLAEPRMSNHARGLWGYTGETPSGHAAQHPIHGDGRAERGDRPAGAGGARRAASDPGRAPAERSTRTSSTASWWWPRDALAEDGASRALGAGEIAEPDPDLTAALAAGLARAPRRHGSSRRTSSTTPTPATGPPPQARAGRLAEARRSGRRDGGGDDLHARAAARRRQPPASWPFRTPSTTASGSGSRTRIWRRPPSAWGRSPRAALEAQP